MIRLLFALVVLALPSVSVSGQYPSFPNYPAMPDARGLQNQFAPNFYNRAAQPLSPYLNLARGGNPAVNYYYGVRPGTVPVNMQMGGLGAFTAPSNFSQLRTGFLPAGANPTREPTPIPEAGVPVTSLQPSGHPITFGPGITRFNPMIGGMVPARPGVFGNSPLPPFNRSDTGRR